MRAERSVRDQKLRIDADQLLLVEGKDEVNLFSALIQHHSSQIPDVQVVDVGGKDNFSAILQALRVEAQTRPSLKFIGVVRDADDNPAGAFQSVCDNLRKAKFEPPSCHGKFSNGLPSVGVFIVPDGVDIGAVETLCRRSVQDSDAAQCVNSIWNAFPSMML